MKPYYEEGGIAICNADCREVIPSLQYGFVLTDPPFGISHESGYGASWQNTQIAGDKDTTTRDEAIHQMLGHPMLVFGSWKAARPAYTKSLLIWDKGPAFGMGDLRFPWKNSFEEIYVIGEGFRYETRDPGVIRGYFSPFSEAAGRCHPNEKPVGLLIYLLKRHAADPILDPFMGSGTVLKAAKELNRPAIGIEIEERYCEIAAKRLSQSVMQFEDIA